jgi:hypothetical protein
MTRGHKQTREETITAKLIELLSDLRTDLDMIGLYFGRYARLTVYRRLEHIYETARHYRENTESREAHYEYGRNISN